MENNREIVDVDIGQFKVASGESVLRTSGIGSCIVITLYEPIKKIGGLAHSTLPGSTNQLNPKYVGSAIKLMIKKMELAGADIKNLEAKIIGGADMFEGSENSSQDIGIQNIQTAIQKLKEKGIRIVAKDIGKNHGRSVEFNLITGETSVWGRSAVFKM